ncbi:glutathione S-transferase U8-like [Rhododendron vialii]|uniref:glutathione S-transferase U8-like n=1 Tax=Rhododendron vialii TaxID=182163 RepID=UPI00265F52A6|nr:glutathione S-transferase U8-like [Rhododendron vialii]
MESKEAVKLLGFWVSPFSFRVEWALRLKGVEYEYIEEDVFNKSPLLLELNPVHKKVPVLIHGDKVILESFIILEYIDETWKQFPIMPQDPYDRAMARFWAKFAEEKFMMSACSAMCTEGEDKEAYLKEAVECLEKIEQELIKGKSKFFSGESIGYLDIAIGWISYWLPVWEEVGSMTIADPTRFPATASWTENFCSHPAVKDRLPPRDKMVVDFQCRRKEIGAAQIASARKG